MIMMQRYAPHTVEVRKLNIHDYLFLLNEKRKEDLELKKRLKKNG